VEGRFAEGLTGPDVQAVVDGLNPVDITDRSAWRRIGR
jgi:hypothetical protein